VVLRPAACGGSIQSMGSSIISITTTGLEGFLDAAGLRSWSQYPE